MADEWTFLHICDMQPGSPRSFRFRDMHRENWQNAYEQLQKETEIDLLLVGGDLTRDGFLHRFELEIARDELSALPYPTHVIPGNMDVGNKCTTIPGANGRHDPDLNLTSETLARFAAVFGEMPWSFSHKNVRFSGFYEAVAGSGLPEEDRMWKWLEEELPACSQQKFHVMLTHYPLFIHRPDEKDWDHTRQDEYHDWYFSLNSPYRQRILEAFIRAGVTHVFSGHIHCRRPMIQFEGIEFYKAAGIAFSQWVNKWPDGDPTLGYYRVHVTPDGLTPVFVPLQNISTATTGYGPGGHPDRNHLDYSIAREKGEIY